MKGNKKGKLASFIIIFLMISMPFIVSAELTQEKQRRPVQSGGNKYSDEKQEKFIVGIGPVGSKSSKECDFVSELSGTQVEHLKEELFSINKFQGSTVDLIKKNLDILRKYDIIPENFYENLSNFLVQQNYSSKENDQSIQPLSQDISSMPKIRFGPTLFFYASLMSQYTFIDDPTNQIVPIFNIVRLNEILESVFNMDNPFFDFTEDISCSYYSKFTTWQIGIGGSISVFASVGPLPNQNYYFFGPFLGVFIFPVTLLGIYIFKEIENPNYPGGSFEMPYLDVMIGMPLVFSLVLPGWYAEPNELY